MTNHIEYSGKDNLEVMKLALNYNRYLIKMILAHCPKDGSIVDFGAGAGTFSLPIIHRGFNVSAVEADECLVDQLKAQKIPVIQDLSQTPDSGFAMIYSLNVLEHILDDVEVVRLWYQKLRPGGLALIYVPAFMTLFTSMDHRVGHHRRYTKESLKSILESTGFEITSCRYADSLGFLATLLYKWLGISSGDINPRALSIYDQWVFPVSLFFDNFLGHVLGKNLVCIARKPLA